MQLSLAQSQAGPRMTTVSLNTKLVSPLDKTNHVSKESGKHTDFRVASDPSTFSNLVPPW